MQSLVETIHPMCCCVKIVMRERLFKIQREINKLSDERTKGTNRCHAMARSKFRDIESGEEKLHVIVKISESIVRSL